MNVCCLQSLRDTSPNRGSYLYQKRVVIYEKDAAVVSNANYFSMSFRVACDVNQGCGKLFIAQRLFFSSSYWHLVIQQHTIRRWIFLLYINKEMCTLWYWDK